MYFDALTLAAVADELRATLLGGRIQRVLLPNELSIGFEVYAQRQRHYLLASAHPQFARIHLVSGKLSRGVEQATPLLLLLRKYALGGRIVAIEQPPLERILLLSIVKEADTRNRAPAELEPADLAADLPAAADDAPDPLDGVDLLSHEGLLRSELVIEPMDRRSNIILVDDDNIILDSIKRVTPRMSQRVVLPRHAYELPPRQEKGDPRTATAAGLEQLTSAGNPDLVKAIVSAYRGVSPQAAREVVFRALGTTSATVSADLPWYSLALRLRELFTAPWQPTLVLSADGPLAYAPYQITHLAGATPQPGISAALATFYAARESLVDHRQRRAALTQQFASARDRLQRQIDQLNSELVRARQLERLRWEGEMIFAFLHSLTPGQTSLQVEGETINLEPERSPVEQAQERFRAYDKAKSALTGVPERLNAADIRLQGLEQLAALLGFADTYDQIEQIEAEAIEQGYLSPPQTARRQPRRSSRLKPLRLVSHDGYEIFVGRTANENVDVTFRIGQPDDLWLHVRIIPGAHVIIKTGGREVPERTLYQAASVAAYFSQARAETQVAVDISRRKRVRKVPGGPPGLVTYQAERTLRVAPAPPWS